MVVLECRPVHEMTLDEVKISNAKYPVLRLSGISTTTLNYTRDVLLWLSHIQISIWRQIPTLICMFKPDTIPTGSIAYP